MMRLRRLTLALLASTFLCAPAGPARAEPISTAIGLTAVLSATLGVSAAAAGVIGGGIISVGLGVGAQLLARVLKSDNAEATQTEKGTQAQLTVGANVPRNRVYGKQVVAGQLGYWNLFGPDNVFLQLVFNLASGPHDFFGLIANGKRATLGAELEGWGRAITDFDFSGFNTAWVNFYNGFYDQDADANLINNAQPAGRWTENHRSRGICYAIVTLAYKPESYPQGIPTFGFEIGARLYDPRKDSSNGGDGDHRWNDQHTWEHSENVALGLYEYERGLSVGDHRVIGRGLAPIDMRRDMFIDAANVCDENVSLKAGGTEPRYRIGMNVGADRDLKSVEADFCAAMAGELIESAGAFGPLAGIARDVAFTFTDDDLIEGGQVRYSEKRPRDQLVNALFGTYSDPAQNYAAIPYAPRTSTADESADGERFAARRDYVQITSQTQAQRVGEIERRANRHQASGAVTLGFKFSPYEASDWCRWISDRRQFDKLFRITRHRLDPTQTISFDLTEISEDVFAFDPDVEELDPLAPGDLPGVGVLISTVPDFEAEELQLDGDGGLTVPALRCLWSTIADRTVDDVIVEYRVGTDDATVKRSPAFNPGDGEGIISDGIQAGTAYQARATITTTPLRAVHFTDWVAVTSPANHIVKQALTADAADEVPAAGILGQIIAAQIADAAITSAKLAAAAVTATAFAAGIEPVSIVATLPSAGGYTGPTLVFNQADGKVYRYASGAFTPNVATADLTGTIVGAQIANAAITASKLAAAAVTATAFAAGIEPVSIVATLPSAGGYTGPTLVFNQADGKVYRYASGAFTPNVAAADLTGQIGTTQIANNAVTTGKIAAAAITATLLAAGAVDATKFAAGIEPVSIVATLPSAGGYTGPTLVFNQADGKVYRYASGVFTPNVATADLSGQITTTQITNNAVTTAKVAANAITAAEIAANTITAAQLAANTITAGQIAAAAIGTTQLAASAVTATIIAAGAVTTAKLAVGNGSNLIPNSDCVSGLINYAGGGNITGLTNQLDSFLGADKFYYVREHVVGVAGAGTVFDISIQNIVTGGAVDKAFPVMPGERYELSGYLVTTKAAGVTPFAYLIVSWWDAAGTNVGNDTTSAIQGVGGGVGLGASLRSGALVTAPATAVQAGITLRCDMSGGAATDPYCQGTNFLFALARPNQTDLSAWSPKGATVVDGGQIVTDSITASQIAANAITTTELNAGAVTAAKIAANTITAAQIAANTITAGQIAANTITAAQLAANTITAGQIAAAAIGTTQLAASAVTATIIAAGAITTAKLAVGSGQNLVPNSDVLGGLINYAAVNLIGIGATTPSLQSIAGPTGMNQVFYQLVGAAPSGALWDFEVQNLTAGGRSSYFPVKNSQKYEISAYLQTSAATTVCYIAYGWYRANGSFISGGSTTPQSQFGGGTGLTQYKRTGAIITAPSDAVAIEFTVRAQTTAPETNPAVVATGIMLAPANDNQTDLSEWSPAGATVIDGGQIVTDSITAGQVAAGAISTSELAANAITAGKISAGAIGTTQLAANAVTTGILAAGAVTTSILAAQAVDSTKVTTSTLITLSAQIASLTVQDIHIVGGSVAVADAATSGANIGGHWPTFDDAVTLTLNFTNTINGTKIPIMLGANFALHAAGTPVIEWEMTVNGTRVGYDFWLPPGAGDLTNQTKSACSWIVGNGGTATAVCKLRCASSAGSYMIAGALHVAAGFKR